MASDCNKLQSDSQIYLDLGGYFGSDFHNETILCMEETVNDYFNSIIKSSNLDSCVINSILLFT